MYVDQAVEPLKSIIINLVKKAGLGSKQQDILLSSFIKRVYAEIEKNQQNRPLPAIAVPSAAETVPQQQQQQGKSEPTKEFDRKRPTKRAMSTPEAIAELNKLCKQEDPCTIYTDMVKIGEGYVHFKSNFAALIAWWQSSISLIKY